MAGYQTEIDALRAAAKAVRKASEQVSDVDLAGAIRSAGDGMPGARCVRSFDAVSTTWHSALTGWVKQADDYADALNKAADDYSANEDAASAAFGGTRAG